MCLLMQAFIKAFRAACTFKGPARVLVPNGNFVAGAMVFEGPCAAPITFQFTGNVKAVTDPSSYSEDSWMLFENINGLVVAGGGTIDGQGQTVWKYNDGGAKFPMVVCLIFIVQHFAWFQHIIFNRFP